MLSGGAVAEHKAAALSRAGQAAPRKPRGRAAARAGRTPTGRALGGGPGPGPGPLTVPEALVVFAPRLRLAATAGLSG